MTTTISNCKATSILAIAVFTIVVTLVAIFNIISNQATRPKILDITIRDGSIIVKTSKSATMNSRTRRIIDVVLVYGSRKPRKNSRLYQEYKSVDSYIQHLDSIYNVISGDAIKQDLDEAWYSVTLSELSSADNDHINNERFYLICISGAYYHTLPQSTSYILDVTELVRDSISSNSIH